MYPLSQTDFLGTPCTQIQAPEFRISIVRYTQQVSEDWHWHAKHHLSAIIRGGNLESRKTKDIQVLPGKIMRYEPGEVHRNRFTAHPSTNLNIEFEESFFGDGLCFSHFPTAQQAHTEFLTLYAELRLNDAYSLESIAHTLKALCWKGEARRDVAWMPQLLALLHDRWDEFLSLDMLAAELGLHPVTISKSFAQYSGITLAEYMRKLKVKRALEALLNSSQALAEIAFQCGFSDQSHMNRWVKHYTGYTPKVIRSLA